MNQLSLLRYWIVSLWLLSNLSSLLAQGCSDTGVGSMPVFRPVRTVFPADKKNRIAFGVSTGAAGYSIFVMTPEIYYTRQMGKHFSADSRITSAWHMGNGVSTFGLGDFFVNLNYSPLANLYVSGGLKICLNRAGKFYTDEIVYPMDYQSSLGTMDFYTGIAYHPGAFHFALAWEHPFSQNQNWFYSSELEYPDSPFNEFPSTFGFIRKGDILFRCANTFETGSHVSFTPGILFINHLDKDELPETSTEGYYSVTGSDGLTINLTLLSVWKLNDADKFEFNLGVPVEKRSVQLEGLDRSVVVSAEYVKLF